MLPNESLAGDESRRWQELFDKARECWEAGDQYGAEDHFSGLMDQGPLGRRRAEKRPRPEWTGRRFQGGF